MSEVIADDFVIPTPPEMDSELCVPLDDALDIACANLKLPALGGPSGRGWSYFSQAWKCPHLFKETYERGDGSEKRRPAHYLQIGGFYHALQGLYYGVGLGDAVFTRRGLCSAMLLEPGVDGRKRRKKLDGDRLVVPATAADDLLTEMHRLADAGTTEVPGPSKNFILQAERLFDAHTSYYGAGNEDMVPLAVEWWASHPLLNYTCRFDLVARLGEHEPLLKAYSEFGAPEALAAGDVVVVERKTAAWFSEMTVDGWFLDGEILGQLMCWKASGCEKLFGPLKAIIVDIVTKAKTPAFRRIVVPSALASVKAHARWTQYIDGMISLWRSSGAFPQNFTSCFDRFGRCGLWNDCAGVAAQGGS